MGVEGPASAKTRPGRCGGSSEHQDGASNQEHRRGRWTASSIDAARARSTHRGRNHAEHADKAVFRVIEIVTTSENSVTCRPVGELDWVGAVYLRDAVAGILQHAVDLVIDFSMVDILDADGIVALRNSMELVRLVGGNTRFCGMSPQVAEALEFAGLDAGDAIRTVRPVRPTARLA